MKNPAENTLLSLFKESVTHFPQQLAVVFNGLDITYKELDEKKTVLLKNLYSLKKYWMPI